MSIPKVLWRIITVLFFLGVIFYVWLYINLFILMYNVATLPD